MQEDTTTEVEAAEAESERTHLPEQKGVGRGTVELIPISKIDLDDTTYMFRANLRVGPLKKSIAAEGQQVPIIVRKVGRTRGQRYQLISGFRRVTAMKELGFTHVSGMIREDLATTGDEATDRVKDELTFKASVLENTARRTYSDIDRAYVIKAYQNQGYSSVEVADLLGLTKRQKNKIVSLLELPKSVQDAVDDSDDKVTTKHAVLLKQLKGKYPSLDMCAWIERTNHENLSTTKLKRAVHAEYKGATRTGFTTLFRGSETRLEDGIVRFQPVKLDLNNLSDDEKASFKRELEDLLERL